MNSTAHRHVTSRSITAIAISALILNGALAGCTANKTESSPAPAEQAEKAEEQVPVPASFAWKTEEVLVSDPTVIDDVAIAYRRVGPQLEVIARNLKNGKQVWKDEALGASDARGISPSIETVEHDGKNYVAYTGTKTGAVGTL